MSEQLQAGLYVVGRKEVKLKSARGGKRGQSEAKRVKFGC
jgi:hypothetical protein